MATPCSVSLRSTRASVSALARREQISLSCVSIERARRAFEWPLLMSVLSGWTIRMTLLPVTTACTICARHSLSSLIMTYSESLTTLSSAAPAARLVAESEEVTKAQRPLTFLREDLSVILSRSLDSSLATTCAALRRIAACGSLEHRIAMSRPSSSNSRWHAWELLMSWSTASHASSLTLTVLPLSASLSITSTAPKLASTFLFEATPASAAMAGATRFWVSAFGE
mmetsp:Transcript_34692/g.87675  ORF Transcript_34692/g.87675 Transcript_34692/m.87675 type:complete len:227 (-) Transcript_34692:427-1107(-)